MFRVECLNRLYPPVHVHASTVHTQNITFPPRLALGGFPALTTLAGPVDSVKTQRWSHYNQLCIQAHMSLWQHK